MTQRNGTVRIGALGDLHYTRSQSQEAPVREVLSQAGRDCDVLLLCGDLTDHGLVEEAQELAREIHASVSIPVIAVLGNHDFEGGHQEEIKRVLCESGIRVLDGDATEVKGVGFAGVKGFCGGFGRRALGPWGEDIIKHFVREAVDEALKLESALARLRGKPRIAVLHYSPIQETVEGEPVEIFPFLGSSRLEEPLSRYPVQAVFHGHAHRGRPEGKTAQGIPVYNVSVQLLRQSYPDRPPFRVFEVPVDDH
ncbi:MAG TPA: metallophosphoesterase [Thermoanaerobaculia bacterium]|jgi:Icc-related predicted phosphoesterase|nr:metallophosphoesterase [Thermoanaerobaculia bacterium]